MEYAMIDTNYDNSGPDSTIVKSQPPTQSNLKQILKDPNYINANDATKKAIFDKHSASDPNYTNANDATKKAIREKFGVKDESNSSESSVKRLGREVGDVAKSVVGGVEAATASIIGGATGLAGNVLGDIKAGSSQLKKLGIGGIPGPGGSLFLAHSFLFPDKSKDPNEIKKDTANFIAETVQKHIPYMPETEKGKSYFESISNTIGKIVNSAEDFQQGILEEFGMSEKKSKFAAGVATDIETMVLPSATKKAGEVAKDVAKASSDKLVDAVKKSGVSWPGAKKEVPKLFVENVKKHLAETYNFDVNNPPDQYKDTFDMLDKETSKLSYEQLRDNIRKGEVDKLWVDPKIVPSISETAKTAAIDSVKSKIKFGSENPITSAIGIGAAIYNPSWIIPIMGLSILESVGKRLSQRALMKNLRDEVPPPTGPTSPPTGPTSPPTGPTSPPTGPTSPPTGPTSPPTGPTLSAFQMDRMKGQHPGYDIPPLDVNPIDYTQGNPGYNVPPRLPDQTPPTQRLAPDGKPRSSPQELKDDIRNLTSGARTLKEIQQLYEDAIKRHGWTKEEYEAKYKEGSRGIEYSGMGKDPDLNRNYAPKAQPSTPTPGLYTIFDKVNHELKDAKSADFESILHKYGYTWEKYADELNQLQKDNAAVPPLPKEIMDRIKKGPPKEPPANPSPTPKKPSPKGPKKPPKTMGMAVDDGKSRLSVPIPKKSELPPATPGLEETEITRIPNTGSAKTRIQEEKFIPSRGVNPELKPRDLDIQTYSLDKIRDMELSTPDVYQSVMKREANTVYKKLEPEFQKIYKKYLQQHDAARTTVSRWQNEEIYLATVDFYNHMYDSIQRSPKEINKFWNEWNKKHPVAAQRPGIEYYRKALLQRQEFLRDAKEASYKLENRRYEHLKDQIIRKMMEFPDQKQLWKKQELQIELDNLQRKRERLQKEYEKFRIENMTEEEKDLHFRATDELGKKMQGSFEEFKAKKRDQQKRENKYKFPNKLKNPPSKKGIDDTKPPKLPDE